MTKYAGIPAPASDTSRGEELKLAIARLDVPKDVLEGLLNSLKETDRGVLLYGSRARGDSVAGSDWDLLALTDTPRKSVHSGELSLSFYSPDQLRTGVGTLFGAHLARDSKVIWDPHGEVGAALANMGDVDTERLFERCRRMSIVLGALDRDLPKYLSGLLREARYLLRSCLYARAIADGEPCFSVREIARRNGKPELVRLLASRQESPPSITDLRICMQQLQGIIGPLLANGHGSLEALIVNEWERKGDLISMAMMALGGSGASLGYLEVEKILL
ncbi:nucleotidyltransferase domain-containing protein [Pengzhenrongella sicca]|uniref:Nucleotidyltransferase domain-containing protein n=1 Tax=Pengzhenrongella sicca TaxID=2819238 RepID=A0A8A4ZDL2_9MICO|nr:nucleotidyltransferase domain-containing protein [Pengzhenrongella sicca]QTE30070.1 nucleotidyltransferase domain-containing protein [Pengzhenrongella sicca]